MLKQILVQHSKNVLHCGSFYCICRTSVEKEDAFEWAGGDFETSFNQENREPLEERFKRSVANFTKPFFMNQKLNLELVYIVRLAETKLFLEIQKRVFLHPGKSVKNRCKMILGDCCLQQPCNHVTKITKRSKFNKFT